MTIALCPPRCALCQAPGQLRRGRPLDLCALCEAALPRQPLAVVAWRPGRGALPFAAMSGGGAAFGPALRLAPFRFGPPVDAMIRGLKFHDQPYQARILGTLLADAVLAEALPLPDALLPMPLHGSRLARRGYNQAEELARFTAQALQRPWQRHWLQRSRATAEQSHLSARQRIANVAGAFHAAQALPPLHVALIDDVITTGSTARAAARVLLDAGLRRVDVWAVARA
ncbi:MAG: ComF family protein [Steroidobacteraceae bacterium]